MNVSVYTSAFNLSSGIFNFAGAIKNWAKYAKEIVIATTTEEEGEAIYKQIPFRELVYTPTNVKVIPTGISLDDPFFDGKLKNAALQACSYDYVIQQDLDERLYGDPDKWEDLICNLKSLKHLNIKAYMIHVLDLCHDFNEYKSIGQKWYLHEKAGTFRGPVNFAKRDDGTIDTDKSDTCELIDANGDLVKAANPPRAGSIWPEYPAVIHYGYLNLSNRKKANEFWGPIWTQRKGSEVKVETDLAELEKIPTTKIPDYFNFEGLY